MLGFIGFPYEVHELSDELYLFSRVSTFNQWKYLWRGFSLNGVSDKVIGSHHLCSLFVLKFWRNFFTRRKQKGIWTKLKLDLLYIDDILVSCQVDINLIEAVKRVFGIFSGWLILQMSPENPSMKCSPKNQQQLETQIKRYSTG